jgi:hypothetical protein
MSLLLALACVLPASEPITLQAAWTAGEASRMAVTWEEAMVATVYWKEDGEELSGKLLESKQSWKQVHVDTILDLDAGVPGRLRRNYLVAQGRTWTDVLDDAATDIKFKSVLHGKSAVYERKGGKLAGRLEDAFKPKDPELLRDHPLTSQLERLLPKGPVEPDATWTFSKEDLLAAVQVAHARKVAGTHEALSGSKAITDPTTGLKTTDRNEDLPWIGDCFDTDYDWTCTAKLVHAASEIGGAPCAVIELEAIGAKDVKSASKRDQKGFDNVAQANLSATLKGELIWDRKRNQALQFKLAGKLSGAYANKALRKSDKGKQELRLDQVTAWSCLIEVEPAKPQLEKAKD